MPQNPAAQPATRQRYLILVMLFVAVVITYLDRNNIGIAVVKIKDDLHLTDEQKGWVMSAFGWTYAALQIPSGWLVDRIRPRLFYMLVCSLWSAATVLQGLAGSLAELIALRLLLGAFEAPAYCIYNRVVTAWFPDRERARAIAIYTAGQYLGPALFIDFLTGAQNQFGWHSVFFITGTVGLVFAAAWYAYYRDPGESGQVNEAELNLIREGGGLAEMGSARTKATPVTWADFSLVLSRRKLWGIYLGQFAVNSTMYFFLTWFPSYLKEARHIDLAKLPHANSIPFFGAFLGVCCSGVLSDYMMKRGISPTTARKAPIIAGLLISTCIIGANFVEDSTWIMVFLTLAFFGNGFSSIAWVMVSSLAPKRLLGLTGGVFNFFGNLAPMLVPLIIGYLIGQHADGTKDYTYALLFVGGVAFMGAMSYIFLVGKVERVEG